MRELTIMPELEEFIPKLQPEEKSQLEENILQNGIRDPICIWERFGEAIIIDGHNRYSIAKKYDLPFETTSMEFSDLNEAKIWMIKNQLGRRNLTNFDRTRLALALHPTIVEGNRKALTDTPEKKEKFDAREKIAEIAGVGAHTVDRVAKIEEKADQKTKEALSRGETSINKVYRQIKDEEERVERQKKIAPEDTFVDVYSTDRRFQAIYADISNIDNPGSLPLGSISEPNAVLFLWVSPEEIFDMKPLIDSWGFTYRTMFVWDRVREVKEEYNSLRHELLLICTKGDCFPEGTKRLDSVQSIEQESDTKPDKFRNIISDMYGGEKIAIGFGEDFVGWARYN